MSTTDELRKMLDERGVEYETDDTPLDTHGTVYYCTSVKDPIVGKWLYEEPPETDLIIAAEYDVGAEEAIAATLGRGTCVPILNSERDCRPYLSLWFVCSECGCQLTENRLGKVWQKFCPNCGRKVVKA